MTPHSRPRQLIWPERLAWAAFAALLVAGVYVRCAGLLERGIVMDEPDTWKYLQVAHDWTQGHLTWMGGGRFYRPAIHLIHAALWKTFGVNLHVIKFANVAFDCCTLSMIFLLTRWLARSTWAGVAAGVLYAFVPNVIRNVWVEQHFSACTCFILLAVSLSVLSERMRRHGILRLTMLALGGFALGAAVNMHPDLMLLTPGFIIGIVGVTAAHRPANLGDRWIANVAVFLGGLVSVYVLGVAFLGAKEVVNVASREFFEHTERYTRIGGELGYLGLLSRVAHESFAGLLEQRLLLLYLFLSAASMTVLVPVCRWILGAPRPNDAHGELGLVLLPVLSYGLLFALTIGWFKSWLLFYPLYPLVIISVVCWHHRFFSVFVRSWASAVAVAGALLVAWHNPHVSPGTLRTGIFAPDRLMAAYEFLRDRTDADNRVLVMPTCDSQAPFPPHQPTAGLTSPVYLGERATYLAGVPDVPLPYTAESLRQVCQKNRIRYVLNLKTGSWAPTWIDATLKEYPQFQMIGSWKPYSHDTEREVVQTFLTAVGATQAADTEDGLFELPPPTSEVMQQPIPTTVAPFTPEVLHTTKLWDFTKLDPPAYAWLFPGLVRVKTPYGAISTVAYGKLAYVDLRGIHLDANTVNGVWIEAMLDDVETEVLEQKPLPPKTEAFFLWARKGDCTPGEWPYTLDRRTALARVNANEPLLFVTTLTGRAPLWSDTITDMTIRFLFSSGPFGGSNVHLIVRRIGLF